MYTKTTHTVRVNVTPVFSEEDSSPAENRFVWAYHILIENRGTQPIQLISRYWHITDAAGVVQEVRGKGVLGEQPVLPPGSVYEYTSGVPLTSPSGLMHGTYRMQREDGSFFETTIPAFSLDSPYQKIHSH